MPKSINPSLVDVPCGTVDCNPLFWQLLNKAPDHIRAEQHSRGSHTGQGTNWAGGYITYEIYDQRRPDWPTEEVEEWRQKIEWEIVSHLNQQNEMKVR